MEEDRALADGVEAYKRSDLSSDDFYPTMTTVLKDHRSLGSICPRVHEKFSLFMRNTHWSQADDAALHQAYHDTFEVAGGSSPENNLFYRIIDAKLRQLGRMSGLNLGWTNSHVQYPCHELYRRATSQLYGYRLGERYASPLAGMYAALQAAFSEGFDNIRASAKKDRTVSSLAAHFLLKTHSA